MKEQRKKGNTNYLAEDVLLQIFLRLPVKSIVKFRCISKSCSDLFKSSYFINTHLKFSHERKEENLLIKGIFSDPRPRDVISIHSVDESLSVLIPDLELVIKRRWPHCAYNVNFVGSCNGIVCISYGFDIILLCPAIHEYRILPPLRCRPELSSFVSVPFRSVLGFGFDPVSNDYKVICLIAEYNDYHDYSHCKARIYNLSTDTWRLKDELLPQAHQSIGGVQLFFNGKVHWWAMLDLNILSMDISTEVVQELGMSKEIESVIHYSRRRRLHVIQDCLAVISYSNQFLNSCTIDIWLMKEYGVKDSWSKCYIVGPLNGRIHPLSTIWDNKHLLVGVNHSWSSSEVDHRMVIWDLSKNEQVHEYTIRDDEIDVLGYKESLISIAKSRRD